MKISSKWTKGIGVGSIAAAALVGAYGLGRRSAEKPRQSQLRQNSISKNDPDLQSILSATQEKLTNCETTLSTLSHREQPLQEKKEKPHTNANEEKSIPLSQPEGSKVCNTVSQKKELQMMAVGCRDFRRSFEAYKVILESSGIDCSTISRIRDLAQRQYSTCIAIITANEDTSYQDVMKDPIVSKIVEDAYTFRDDQYSDLNIAGLVKNPQCEAKK